MAAVKIEGRESVNYSFEYGNDDLKKEISKLDPEKDSVKISDLESKFKFLKYEIQEPTFDEIVASLSQIGSGDSAGLIGCGKVIWELCCISFDKEIEKTPSILISICLKLATEYSLPTDIEIKKK